MNSGKRQVAGGRMTATARAAHGRRGSRVARWDAAFTIIEMLAVMAILAVLAVVAVPAIKNLGKSSGALSASRQLLDAVGHARQLAVKNHTTVFMVFVPTNFWGNVNLNNLTLAQLTALTNLCDRQLSGYTFIAYGALGDQPGQHTWHYLEPWQSLPDSSFIPPWKFALSKPFSPPLAMPINDPVTGQALFKVYGFNELFFPFPTVDAPLLVLPCIAFNYLGQLTFDGQNPASQDEYIPLGRGSVLPAMDPSSKAFQLSAPLVSEDPPGNSTNSAYNLVDIDPLTGRATLKFQQVR
jgi:prepilin-type N-terminal cleavage/methylation domain-containing protein